MSKKVDVERAFKDKAYLKTLTPKQLASVTWDPSDQQMYIEAALDKMFRGIENVARPCKTTTGSCLATKRMNCA
jgi:hypothetical protein